MLVAEAGRERGRERERREGGKFLTSSPAWFVADGLLRLVVAAPDQRGLEPLTHETVARPRVGKHGEVDIEGTGVDCNRNHHEA